jgi:hypothetical protein
MPNLRTLITTNNALQNLTGGSFDRANERGNLSVQDPTVEQLNAAVTGSVKSNEGETEAAFGEHVREAVDVVHRALR